MAVKSKKVKTPLEATPTTTAASGNSDSTFKSIIAPLDTSDIPLDPKDKPAKVNTANLGELKHACDDAVKAYFGRPAAFAQSHIHEDVRLVLGWSSALIGFAAAYYGYKVPFQESKFLVGVGVVTYAFLSAILALYVVLVEKDVVFEGKRRTIAGRVSTERLIVSTTAAATASSPSYFSLASLLSLLSITSKPSTTTPTSPYPNYTLTLHYVHSSNNGKALIHKDEVRLDRCFGEFFDQEGRFWKDGFEEMLAGLLRKAVGSN